MEELDYDIVVYGTGLVNCLITSIILKKLNKSSELKDDNEEIKGVKILNIDKHNEYGNNYRTLSLKQFLSLNNVKSLKNNVNNSTTNNDDNLEDNDNKEDDNSTINDDNSVNLDDNRDEKNELKTIYYEINPFGKEGDENEFKDLINNKNNEFNIDLWPKLILNNSHFVDYLIFTNLYKQIQFTTNFNNNIYFFNPNFNNPNNNNSSNNNNKDKENDKDDSTNNSNVDKKDKDKDKKEKDNGSLFELIYDKNSIFRSNYLTIREKRILTKFLHYHSSSFPNNNTNKDDNNKEDNNKNENDNKLILEKKENWIEYLRRNNLNEKLLDLVNYGMCFNESEVLELEMNKIKLNNYIKSFDVNKKNKNCFIYSLYGLNNIIQYICRLCSLYNCHYMLNNSINSFSENSFNNTIDNTFKHYSRNYTTSIDNKEDNLEDDNNNNNENKKEDDKIDKEEEKEDNNDNSDDKKDNFEDNNNNKEDKKGKRSFVLELNGYKIYTNYIISEYDIPFTYSDNNSTSTTNSTNSTKDYKEDKYNLKKEDEKIFVTCLISNKKLFNGFNMCIIPNNLTTDNSRINNHNNPKEDKEEEEEEDKIVYVIQTCKDNLTSPEGVYILYFMTKTREDYQEEINLKELIEGRDKHKDLLRILKLFETLCGDLSNILFISYSSFNSVHKVQFVTPDTLPGGFQVHNNFYSLDNLCISNELYISQCLSNSFLQIFNSKNLSNNNNNEEQLLDNNKYEEQLLDNYKNNYKVDKEDRWKMITNKIDINEEMIKKFNLENHIKYKEEEESDWDINCDFLNEFINKFF